MENKASLVKLDDLEIIILITFVNINRTNDNNISNRKNTLNEKTKANLQKTTVRIEPHVHRPRPAPFRF